MKLESGLFDGMTGSALWSGDCTAMGAMVDSPVRACRAVPDNR